MRIAVIGGGASGLMAAIAAKCGNNKVTIYERSKRVGRKLLATGNGRCNMTNTGAAEGNYYGTDPGFVKNVIDRFWVKETLDFFTEIGVLWKEEKDGKVYPYCDSASAVLDVLRHRTECAGVLCECGFDVKSVKKSGNTFLVEAYDGRRGEFDRVIIAAGGKAAPALGSNGSGYELLKSFGHSITGLSPSLVQIKTETDTVKKLKGIKLNARLSIGGRSETGELLFTEYGLSGPPAFSLSAILGDNKEAVIDAMPEYDYIDVVGMLRTRKEYLHDITLEEYFTGMLNKRIGQAILKDAGFAPLSSPVSALSERDLKKIASVIKGWRFKITGTMSWNNAQVTKGGALTSEFDGTDMQSKLIRGLYACGEVLDIDGDCGGYNLQWAWSSGYIAGYSAGSQNDFSERI